MANEPYVKAFQYKILNSILYTNTKLFKIGYNKHDKCTFCNNESETLHHLFFNCPHSNLFWKHLEKFYFNLTKQLKVLSLQEIIIGITASSCPLLKIKTKYQIAKYIATKNNDLEAFYKKWMGNFPLLV